MPFTALSLVQEFCNKRGLPSPAAVYGSSEKASRQFTALLNTLIRDLSRFNWKERTTTLTWTSSAVDQVQGTFGVGFLAGIRSIIPNAFWAVDKTLPVIGPLTPVAWQVLSIIGVPGPEYQYTTQNNQLWLLPVPVVGTPFSAVVKTNLNVVSDLGVLKNLPTEDGDTFFFDDNALLLGLEYFWAKIKGEPMTELMSDYYAAVASAMSDLPGTILSLEGSTANARPGILIPPGNWNVS